MKAIFSAIKKRSKEPNSKQQVFQAYDKKIHKHHTQAEAIQCIQCVYVYDVSAYETHTLNAS